MFSAVPNRFKYRQNAYFRDIVLKVFSAIQNRFKYRQNAYFREIVLKVFSAIPNRFKYRQNACVRDITPGSYTFWFDHLVIVIGCQIIVLNKSEHGDDL